MLVKLLFLLIAFKIYIVFDRASGTMYKQSSQVLNNNGIVRELSYRYKNQFDSHLGGLSR
ncbi:hypothetical protein A0249_09110 [Campylobacter upsaliensis]|nr:hypothetical protein [Campylobacter upsaliensis]